MKIKLDTKIKNIPLSKETYNYCNNNIATELEDKISNFGSWGYGNNSDNDLNLNSIETIEKLMTQLLLFKKRDLYVDIDNFTLDGTTEINNKDNNITILNNFLVLLKKDKVDLVEVYEREFISNINNDNYDYHDINLLFPLYVQILKQENKYINEEVLNHSMEKFNNHSYSFLIYGSDCNEKLYHFFQNLSVIHPQSINYNFIKNTMDSIVDKKHTGFNAEDVNYNTQNAIYEYFNTHFSEKVEDNTFYYQSYFDSLYEDNLYYQKELKINVLQLLRENNLSQNEQKRVNNDIQVVIKILNSKHFLKTIDKDLHIQSLNFETSNSTLKVIYSSSNMEDLNDFESIIKNVVSDIPKLSESISLDNSTLRTFEKLVNIYMKNDLQKTLSQNEKQKNKGKFKL